MREYALSWGMLALSVVFNAFGVFVIKWRLNELGAIKMESWSTILSYFVLLIKSPWAMIGVFLFFVAPFLFAVALSRMEVTVAYPAQVGLNFVIIILLALVLLGEQMNFYKIFGIILTLSALYFFHKGG